MRIYLDACCVNRPLDDQSQDRIRLEAEAVLLILAHVEAGEWEWIGSGVLDFEIARIPDSERRLRTQLLLRSARPGAPLSDEIGRRASKLASMGLSAVDALHVAVAEASHVDVFLTTDDRLAGAARRLGSDIALRIRNPLAWLKEMTDR